MQQIHTPTDHVKSAPSLGPAVRTANANGGAVDRAGFQTAKVNLHVGAHDRTTGDETLDVKIQGSADGATGWTDLTGASFAQIGNVVPDATKGNAYTMSLNLKDVNYRYIRAVGTVGGTTPSTAYSVNVELFNPNRKPVTQTFTPVKA